MGLKLLFYEVCISLVDVSAKGIVVTMVSVRFDRP